MKIRILLLCIIASVIVCLPGCKKLDFNYRQFIGDGEITYLGKADSLLLRGGDLRAEISWLLISDPKVTSYKIYWDNRQYSQEGSLIKTDGIDTVSFIIDDLEEKPYEFEVVLMDDEGNSSIVSSAVGLVYGPTYESSLVNRIFRSPTVLPEDKLELTWSFAESTLLYSELKYQNVHNESVTHIIKPDVTLDTLIGFPNGGTFELRSAFLPDSLAIDTFYTEYMVYEIEEQARSGEMAFDTRVQYGAQPNQLSILISQDFDGIYEEENVNAATWIDITDEYDLATANTGVEWGAKDVTPYWHGYQSFYVAFRYQFTPGEGGQRTWRIENFRIGSPNIDEVYMDQEEADFQLVHQEATFEDGRSSISPTLILLRGNTAGGPGGIDVPTTTWAISKRIDP